MVLRKNSKAAHCRNLGVSTLWLRERGPHRRLGRGIPAGTVRCVTVQLEGDEASPRLGYKLTTALLKSRQPFTAVFAFNDISAMGAIRALHESGLRVPEDISVVAFDDIQSAAYQHPGLTTVRQPLRKMGATAAEIPLRRIRPASPRPTTKQITVAPELIVRETTCAPRGET
jgi:DNA-binding LacI/PurR family transcriptional regulator